MSRKCMNCLTSSFIYSIFVCVLLLLPSEDCNAAPEGLVSAWLLDEGDGDIARDASGNGHDGEVRNANWVEGKFGNALEFGPADSAVVIPHSDDFTLEFFTVTGWVKCEDQGAWQTIMTKTGEDEAAQPRNYGIFVVPNDGGIHFSLQGGNTKIDSQEKVTDGEWHLVVMTRDEDGTLRGYIDGVNVVEGGSDVPGVNDEDVSIGAGGGGVRYWLIGSVDEVAIFDRALSEAEINGLMEGGLALVLAVNSSEKLTATWGKIRVGY